MAHRFAEKHGRVVRLGHTRSSDKVVRCTMLCAHQQRSDNFHLLRRKPPRHLGELVRAFFWVLGAQAVVAHLRTITNKLSVALTIRLAMIVRTSVMLIVSNSLLPMESVSSNIFESNGARAASAEAKAHGLTPATYSDFPTQGASTVTRTTGR